MNAFSPQKNCRNKEVFSWKTQINIEIRKLVFDISVSTTLICILFKRSWIIKGEVLSFKMSYKTIIWRTRLFYSDLLFKQDLVTWNSRLVNFVKIYFPKYYVKKMTAMELSNCKIYILQISGWTSVTNVNQQKHSTQINILTPPIGFGQFPQIQYCIAKTNPVIFPWNYSPFKRIIQDWWSWQNSHRQCSCFYAVNRLHETTNLRKFGLNPL